MLFIYSADRHFESTRDGKPVIHYQDSNQPSEVTGYNVYRAAAAMGPWTLLGSNVVDMDEGTPDHQYVDQTGDVGSWFYEVAAWNAACGSEGPYRADASDFPKQCVKFLLPLRVAGAVRVSI